MATKIYIIPDIRSNSAYIKESDGTAFLCPVNTVMTGRWHDGDENGNTVYQYSTLKAIDENNNPVNAKIEVTDILWSNAIKESDGTLFQAAPNRVIVGRKHTGDENGSTQYATAVVKVNGIIAATTAIVQSNAIVESSATWFMTDAHRVIVGRCHIGDENGKTFYITAIILSDTTEYEQAPIGTIIIPDVRSQTGIIIESDSYFLCPPNTVMTGRWHDGDENGETQYQYATLKAVTARGESVSGDITVEDIIWHPALKESDGIGFDAPVNRVIVGRKHTGDENGNTQYATGVVKFNKYPTFVLRYAVSEPLSENTGSFECGERQVITARHHYGDENGYTYYGIGTIFCHKSATPIEFPFDLIVSLHENEENFPMSATDYITLSRFRQHKSGKTDDGYNKDTGTFIPGNSHAPEYYNIPISVINTYYAKKEHYRLFNLRPHDGMREPDGNTYFLQPFANLCGDTDPNGKVPAYVNILEYNLENGSRVKYIDFWLFFGYNAAPKAIDLFHYSHQGDWEHVMVELVDDNIQGAWLSAHGPAEFYSTSQLNISIVNDRPQITVYCAIGSHALYNRVGTFDLSTPTVKDYTSYAGYKWKITDYVARLTQQQWREYAGAWGEVGGTKHTTGPLGAWYKRFNFWYDPTFILDSVMKPDEAIVVPDQTCLSEEHAESEGFAFEAPDGMVMIGRKHTGDENGPTICLYASLKLINAYNFKVDGDITITDIHWSDPILEAQLGFKAPDGYVILGRQHTGGVASYTRYKLGKILVNNIATTVEPAEAIVPYQIYDEDYGVFFRTSPYLLYTGRMHLKPFGTQTVYNLMGLVRVNK